MSTTEFLGVMLGDQCFGLPVAQVRDLLAAQPLTPVPLTPVPLAPPAIIGLLNLRGRVVTAIDLRTCLGMEARAASAETTLVVVETGGEFHALMVDAVAEVMAVAPEAVEPVPMALAPVCRAVATAVYLAEHGLVVLLSLEKLLDAARLAGIPMLRAAS